MMDTVDTKQQLLEAAKVLFAQKGFAGVSVKEICERAGVNVSLVSYYFEGKEGLYKACLERFGREKLAAAERILETPKTLDEMRLRLTMFGEEMMRCHVDDPDQIRLVQRAVTFEHDPIAAEIFDKSFVTVFETFVNFLQGAQGLGIVRKDLDCFLSGTVFFGSLMHFGMTDHIRVRHFGPGLGINNPEFRKNALKEIVEVFVRGTAA